MDGIDRHHAQAVELFGRHHRADFGRRRGPGSSRGEEGGQHGSEFADQAQADDRTERVLRAEANERVVTLQAENHADRQTADADDDERKHAELEDLRDETTYPERRRGDREKDPERKDGELAEIVDEAKCEEPQVFDGSDAAYHRPPFAYSARPAGGSSASSAASAGPASSVRKLVTRGSGLARSSSGVPSIGVCGSRRRMRFAMRIV